MKTRFCDAAPVKSALSEQFGRDIFELDTNLDVRMGGFSRHVTPLMDSVNEAIRAAINAGTVGDVLVRPIDTGARRGWQAFERRTAKGRVCVPNGSHARMVSVGSGRIFIA